jgi:hypothetical protein
VSASGGSYRPLSPAWSPDGRILAVAPGEVVLVRAADGAVASLAVFVTDEKRAGFVYTTDAYDGPASALHCVGPVPAGSPVGGPSPRRAAPGLLARFLAGP